MRAIPLLAVVLVAQSAGLPSPASFDRYFTAETMRVDYFHTGGPTSGETIALDRVVNDGAWAGSRTQLVDPTNLGAYLFEVHDTATGTLLYSRGFGSIYGEWQTTAEAKTAHRTFHESLRCPWPKQAVSIVLKKRQPDNAFTAIWTTEVDPASRFVNRRRFASMPAPCGPSSRMDRPRRRSTCSSSQRATRRKSCRNSTRTSNG